MQDLLLDLKPDLIPNLMSDLMPDLMPDLKPDLIFDQFHSTYLKKGGAINPGAFFNRQHDALLEENG
jgi:hypothetical protein